MNQVILMGRATRQVELKYTQGGMAVANVTIAIDRKLSKAKREEAVAKGEATADFVRIVAFSHTAEFLGNHLKKGKMFAVEGRINSGSYEDKDGKRVYTTDIIANDVKILEWGDKETSTPGFTDAHNEDIPF